MFEYVKSILTDNPAGINTGGSVDSINTVVVRSGTQPTIIVVNGFLSKGETDVSDWLSLVNEIYPNNEVIHVKWNAGSLADLAFDDGLISNNMISKLLLPGGSKLVKTGAAALMALNKTAGHWKEAFNSTKGAGLSLAKVIENTPGLHECILMGHSLGARVVHHTLANLSQPHIKAAYFLAGAVSSESREWTDIFIKHEKTKLINCMSQKDNTLKYAYKTGSLFDHEPIGLKSISEKYCSNVMNIDATEHATGHMKFKSEKVGEFIKKELTMSKRVPLKSLSLV